MSNIEELVETTEVDELETNDELTQLSDDESGEYVAQVSGSECELEEVKPVKVKKKVPLQAPISRALF